ncbi:rsbT co-antagonist protein RsbR [Amycolatopsis arida]|uniref:RsbT co-antagonist protein RsbR n=1 Tax=Amycolatopsis arida TaxID=587909 RepID=A0A1I5V809_9PSEU|nr:STAS domain-containing protein [Amycolatopsis arida]TDX91184.1 rsbT co-antagonist protein RsbR [Amycolatopsis arida]SFQ03663.1 rsbT co-antagonist protein RsbR [Amycolatopsis arida]
MRFEDEVGAAAGDLVLESRNAISEAWLRLPVFARRRGYDEEQAVADCHALVSAVAEAVRDGRAHDPASPAFAQAKPILSELADARARAGVSAAQAALELNDLKAPLLELLVRRKDHAAHLEAALLSTAVDSLRLLLMDLALNVGSDVIAAQRQQLMELSTPVITLWKGVLAVPLIGTLDSARSQTAMENLLHAIVDQRAEVAILDITGVPTIDTMVAQHLLKTAMAARLMGAHCIISGIRPQIAQTMVQLGIDLEEVTTRASLSDALAFALDRFGVTVRKAGQS